MSVRYCPNKDWYQTITDIMKVVFYYFISVYCLIKDFLGIPKGSIKKHSFLVRIFIQTCIFTLTFFALLFVSFALLPICMFLLGMDLYLKWKLGDNYGGRLKGQDAQQDSSDEKVSISILLILNLNEDKEVILKRLHKLAEGIHKSFYKLSCTVQKCMGFAYYVKDQVTEKGSCVFVKVNDEEYLTKNALMEYIQKKHMLKTINGKRLWFTKIFTQPILWNKKSETNKQIAIILVFRHCLADGVSLIGLLKNFMLREENPERMKLDAKYTTTPSFSLNDAYLYRNPFTAKKDQDAFGIAHKERQIAFYIEDEIKYVPMVKKIKSKLGMGFTEILISGLSASIAELLSNRGKSMEKCTMGILYRPINSDLASIINGTYDYDSLTNDATLVMVCSPVTMKEGATMKERTLAVSAEIEKTKTAVDGLAYYAIGNLAHLLPAPLIKLSMDFITNATGGGTNVGGLKAGTVAGCEVETALSFISYYFMSGFRLSIITKGDRFQLALTTRENLLHNRNEAQTVLNNIFKFVDQLNEEIENE